MSDQKDADRPERPRNADQFVELLGSQERHVLTYAYSLTGNLNDAEEVMQRVRLKLWKQFDQFDENLSFAAWAKAIPSKKSCLRYGR